MSPVQVPVDADRGRLARVIAAAAVGLYALAATAGAQTLGAPTRIAEGPPGLLLVSDARENVVVALDETTLAPVWSVAVAGTPMAVGFAANLVLIGNATTHTVEVYRLKGSSKGPGKELEFQFNLGHTPVGASGTIQTPSDLAIDKDARLVFVVDSGERKLKVFDLDGTPLSTLPVAGAPELLSPTSVAVDPTRQEVLVSDYGDPNGSYFSGATVPARVLVFSYAGTFVSQLNGYVTDPGSRFARPQGLAVDSVGRIYMAECARGEVYVFDRQTATVVRKIGEFGDGPGQLGLPTDVLIRSKSADLIVTNTMFGRIEVFSNAGALP